MNPENLDLKAAFQKIQRGSVVEEIIELFKEKILSGELRPGERIPSEKQLMEQIGVGRTALREAIRMMTAIGVIEVRQGEGSFIVSEPTSAILNPLVFAIMLSASVNPDLLELRTMLQVGYCQLAADKATPQDLLHIEAAAASFESMASGGSQDTAALTEADLSFHSAIIEATHNPLIFRICGTVENLFFTTIRSTISKTEGLEWGIEGHRQIIAAIKSKDQVLIRQVVVNSLERWRNELDAAENLAAQAAATLQSDLFHGLPGEGSNGLISPA